MLEIRRQAHPVNIVVRVGQGLDLSAGDQLVQGLAGGGMTVRGEIELVPVAVEGNQPYSPVLPVGESHEGLAVV